MKADKALEQLNFTFKRASNPVSKVLKQAIANATNNLKLDAKSLVVDTAFATKGRTLKRGLFGGRMRYKPFERIASHLTINLKSVAAKATTLPRHSDQAKRVEESLSQSDSSTIARNDKQSNKSNSSNKTNIKSKKQ